MEKINAYGILCSNGKWVQKTRNGSFITMGKIPKVWTNHYLAIKNLEHCEEYAESEFVKERNGELTFMIIEF